MLNSFHYTYNKSFLLYLKEIYNWKQNVQIENEKLSWLKQTCLFMRAVSIDLQKDIAIAQTHNIYKTNKEYHDTMSSYIWKIYMGKSFSDSNLIWSNF